MKAAAAVAEILKREGVGFLIGYPVNPIIEAASEADIRTIIVRQERTGLHMADAVSRISSGERIGVFAMQHGPGAENSVCGVAQSYGDSVPIVVLPACYPRRLINIPPNFNSFINYQHVTKWAEQVVMADAVPDAMRRAFTQVKNGRPRPVLVEIPRDVLGEEVPEPLQYRPAPRVRTAPDPRDVARVAEALVAAERPVIYAGQGVHYARAWQALRELVELLEAPVTTSLQGKSAFPETHPLSPGSGGRSGRRGGPGDQDPQDRVALPVDAAAHVEREAALALPGPLGPDAHRRREPHDHHPRRGQPPRPDLALLGARDPLELHRLGQDDPARDRTGLRDGGQARGAGQALRQRLGRRGDRFHGDGLRDRGARAHPDPVGAPQQLLDGDRAQGDEGRDGEVPLDRHQRPLRRHGARVRRPRRAGDGARRDRPRHQARDPEDRGGRARAPRIHHREGRRLLHVRVGDRRRLEPPAMQIKYRIGVMPGPWPAGPDGRELFWRMIETCERTDIDSLWFSERLSSPLPVLEPMIAMAAVAARTRRLKFGPSVLVAPFRSPVLAAREDRKSTRLNSSHSQIS